MFEMMSLLHILYVLIAIIFILFMAYAFTRVITSAALRSYWEFLSKDKTKHNKGD
jgi:flagellar biogenesis protein FliO